MTPFSKLIQSAKNTFCWLPNRTFQVCGRRNSPDEPKKPVKKEVMVQGTGNEQRLRVRRARPIDTVRVLRFVRNQVRHSWPGLSVPPVASQTILDDYMSRTLAQGHTMLAEQHEPRLGWNNICGIALGGAVCPWDANLLEKFARCVRCPKARQLLDFSAHCMRGPELHRKYRVQKILQILLIVPPEIPNSSEVAFILAKSAMKRGRDAGFSLLRFDVNNKAIERTLKRLQLKKEWHLAYEILPERDMSKKENKILEETKPSPGNLGNISNFITVYSKSFTS